MITTEHILLGAILAETSYLAYRSLAPSDGQPRITGAVKIVCDTSALIDGRVASIARSGFISSELIVPRSVVRELQNMADRADHDKRERARYGLDVINELQDIPHLSVVIYDDGELHHDGVDEQLIVLAKKLGARLCTTDYNLNKVARTEGVMVVNVNEIAHALRPVYLPGERLKVAIVSEGQNKDQGVGYLDDGTMVVIDHAKRHIGQVIEAETVKVLQTEAGKMVFAKSLMPKAQQVKEPIKTSRPNQSSHRRRIGQQRTSPEDSLVDLANRG